MYDAWRLIRSSKQLGTNLILLQKDTQHALCDSMSSSNLDPFNPAPFEAFLLGLKPSQKRKRKKGSIHATIPVVSRRHPVPFSSPEDFWFHSLLQLTALLQNC